MMQIQTGPVLRLPNEESQRHEARADQHDDGTWEGAVRHWQPNNRDALIAQYGQFPANPNLIDPVLNPAAQITTLRHKFPTKEMALRHAQIYVEMLEKEQQLLLEIRASSAL